MATPMVSSLAGLLLSLDLKPVHVKEILESSDVQDKMQNSPAYDS